MKRKKIKSRIIALALCLAMSGQSISAVAAESSYSPETETVKAAETEQAVETTWEQEDGKAEETSVKETEAASRISETDEDAAEEEKGSQNTETEVSAEESSSAENTSEENSMVEERSSVENVAESSVTEESALESVTEEETSEEVNAAESDESISGIFRYTIVTSDEKQHVKITGLAKGIEDTSIVIPESVDEVLVKEIGYSAFEGCTGLETITLPSKLEKIGTNAFKNCTGLASVELPETVTELHQEAFTGCSRLKEVKVPKNVTRCAYPFRDCGNLTKIEFAEGMTKIPDLACYNCTQLKTAVLPETVTEIGYDAFEGCTGLETITLPSKLEKIGTNAFKNCTGLASVELPETVTELHQEAFAGCSGLKEVKVPKNVTECTYPFRDCENLTKIEFAEGMAKIPNHACYNCTQLKTAVLPETVTEIGYDAFDGCTGLETITLPSKLEKIGTNAFKNCTGLASVELPETVTELHQEAFAGCSGLEEVKVPKNVTECTYPFRDCENLTKIEFAEGMTKIPNHACYNCTQLKTVILPETVTEIEYEAFDGCTGLETITLPSKLEKIGTSVFKNCTGLTELTFPYGLKSIYSSAFSGCTSLKEVEFFYRLKALNTNAFSDCTSLESAWFNSADTKIYGTPFSGTSANLKIYGYKYANAITHAKSQGIKFQEVDVMSVEKDGLAVANKGVALDKAIVLYNKERSNIMAILDKDYNIVANGKGAGCESVKVFVKLFDNRLIERVEQTKEGSLIGYYKDTSFQLPEHYVIEYADTYVSRPQDCYLRPFDAPQNIIRLYIGDCVGIALTSLMAHYYGEDEEFRSKYLSTDIYNKYYNQFSKQDINIYSYDTLIPAKEQTYALKLNKSSKLQQFITILQGYQNEKFEKKRVLNLLREIGKQEEFLKEIENYIGIKSALDKQKNILVDMKWRDNTGTLGHEMLIDTSKNIEYASADDIAQCNLIDDQRVWYKVHIIDNNYPAWNYSGDDNPNNYNNLVDTTYNVEKALLFSDDGNAWRYCVSMVSGEKPVIIGKGLEELNKDNNKPEESRLFTQGAIWFTEVDKSSFEPETEGPLSGIFEYIDNHEAYIEPQSIEFQNIEPNNEYTISAIAENMTVKDNSGTIVFDMNNSEVLTDTYDGFFKPEGYILGGSNINKFELTLPIGSYTVETTNGTWFMDDSVKLCGISSSAPAAVSISALNDITVTSSEDSEVSYYLGNMSGGVETNANIDYTTYQETANTVHLALSDEGNLTTEADKPIIGDLDAWRTGDTDGIGSMENVSSEKINGKDIVEYAKTHSDRTASNIIYYDGEDRLELTPSTFTGQEEITLPIPAKEGYEFIGWYETPEFDSERVQIITEGTKEDKTFYAKWAEIVRQKDADSTITTLSVELAGTGRYTYTGSPITPEIVVRDEGRILKEGTDYTVKYKNNTNAGTTVERLAKEGKAPLLDSAKAPAILVTGKGNYKGSKAATMNFTIHAKDFSGADIRLTSENSLAVKKNNAAQQLPVTLFYGSKKLSNGKDFKVVYDYYGTDGVQVQESSLNAVTKVGVYEVHVKASDSNANFIGELPVYKLYVQEGTTVLGNAKVKLAAKSYEHGKSYQLEQVIQSITFGSGKQAVTYTTAAAMLEKFDIAGLDVLTAEAGTAYLTITAKEQSGYYGRKSVAVKISGTKLSNKNVLLDSGSKNLEYTGRGQAPAFRLADGASQLVEGKDYTVSYLKGKVSVGKPSEVGSYSAVYTGKGAYEGTVKQSFKIVPTDLAVDKSNVHVTAENAEYTPKGAVPEVNITYKNKLGEQITLTDDDYMLSFSNNKKRGTAYVTIKGKGNYKGTIKNAASFEVVPRNFASEGITVVADEVLYKAGADIKPKVTVYNNGTKLNAKEYTITCKDAADGVIKGYTLPSGAEYGYIDITVTAKAGNYVEGSTASTKLHVYTKSMKKAELTLAEPNRKWYYNAKSITPEVRSVKLDAAEVPFNAENGCMVSYGNNVNVGKGTIIVQGTGAYGGSKTITFTIWARWLQWLLG